jgi:DNA-directed RNA polymerase specialized sigma24 family protein
VNKETKKRLDVLYRKHHQWLFSVAFKASKDMIISEELVQELYLYLLERNDEALYFKDSYNLQYCRAFIISRFYNLKKVDNRWLPLFSDWDSEDIPYDEEWDNKLEKSYKEVLDELSQMKKKKGWSSAMLFELYWFSDKTFDELSKEIGISKSTAFLNVKKIKTLLKEKLDNPFNKEKNEE